MILGSETHRDGEQQDPRLNPACPPAACQSGGCGLRYTVTKVGEPDSEATFAGTRGNDEDAPIPAVRRVESNGRGKTHFGHSPFADLRLGVSFTEYGIGVPAPDHRRRESCRTGAAAGQAAKIAAPAVSTAC